MHNQDQALSQDILPDHSPDALPLAHWKLIDLAPDADDAAMPLAPLDLPGMIDVATPHDLYLALHACGRIPHPFDDRAEAACAWVRTRAWWYRADFEVAPCAPGERLVLDFEGLDTFAGVWLNGQLLGRTDNMFRRWRFDIGALVRPGVNRLALAFRPAAQSVTPVAMPPFPMASSPSEVNHRNFMRKAQFGWGWDFAPNLVTTGLWKPATLRREREAVLDEVVFTTDAVAADGAYAQVTMRARVDAFAGADADTGLSVEFTLRAPDGAIAAQRTLAPQGGACALSVRLERPALWWTPELGRPDLYRLEVVLVRAGRVLARRTLRVGVRTIALDTSPDPVETGASFFRFVLNGVPVFARGVNWVPPSSLVGAIDTGHYRRLLDMARGAHMNMIRVWGGGIYEHDAFYALCDELGLLVWQDFMFACAPYPEHDPAFIDNVRHEVTDQVRRLRHHACLALWCGNNENQAIQGFTNSKAGRTDSILGELFYQQVIPALLATLDPGTPYRPGSPFGGPQNNHNSMMEGDVHDWTVWHGLPTIPPDAPVGDYDRSPEGVAYTRYAEDMGRFISEFGIQSAPSMSAFRRMLPGEQLRLGSPGFANRLKDRPADKVNAMLVSVTGLPETLEDYVTFTQLTQAEGLKFGIEHFRRRKPHCSGTLVWQFNDCWPGISWSLVDYYGYAKAAYHYVRRAFAPLAASFRQDGAGVELWIVNDTAAPCAGVALVALDTFGAPPAPAQPVPYTVGPNRAARVWRSAQDAAPGAHQVLSVRAQDGAFPANRHFFAAIKDLARRAARAPRVDIAGGSANDSANDSGNDSASANSVTITVTAHDYLHFVHVLCDDEDVLFDDNYFDLRAGETRTITASHPRRAPHARMLSVHWR